MSKVSQVKLNICNYGIQKIADFSKNFHDAMKCMKLMNDTLIASHGCLPDKIFYYLTYQSNGVLHYYVDASTTLSEVEQQIKLLRVKS